MRFLNKLTLKLALWLLKHGYGRPYGSAFSYHADDHDSKYYDVNTASVYDAYDYSLLNKYFKRISYAWDKGERSRLIDNYYTHIYRRYNDHHIPHDVRFPEILDIGVVNDRVVFNGLERQAELITGKSNRYMSHYAIGAGVNVNSTQVKPGETFIDDEVAREQLQSRGFADAKGSSIAFGIIFPVTVPTVLITNSGITDGEDDNFTILYLRTNYIGTNRIQLTFNETFGAFTSIIYQRSV